MTLPQPLIARIRKTHGLRVDFMNRLLEQFEVVNRAIRSMHTQDFSARVVGNHLGFKRVRTGPIGAALSKTTLLFTAVAPPLFFWVVHTAFQ